MDKPKILVAHSERSIRRILKMLLRAEGFRVVSAPNGPLAIARASMHRPDVVLVSGHLPDPNHYADGFRVTAYIKGNRKLRGTRVILLTTEPGPRTERKAREHGADVVYGEPFRSNTDLMDKVRGQLTAAR